MRRSALITATTLAAVAVAASACGTPGKPAASQAPSPVGVQSSVRDGAETSAAEGAVKKSSTQGDAEKSATRGGGENAGARGSGGGQGASTGKRASGVDGVAATKLILAGKRQALIHIAEDDKDWSATYEGPIAIGGGTDDGALFRIIPAGGGKFLIEALRAREEGGRWCVNADTSTETTSLGTVECVKNEKTLFRIAQTDETDDKGRPTHTIFNETYGAVQVANDGSELYIEQVGDGGTRGTYSFVDRGPLA